MPARSTATTRCSTTTPASCSTSKRASAWPTRSATTRPSSCRTTACSPSGRRRWTRRRGGSSRWSAPVRPSCSRKRRGRRRRSIPSRRPRPRRRSAPRSPGGCRSSRSTTGSSRCNPTSWRSELQFGIFLAPFHPVGQNPTLALERDLDLIVHLDKLGFDEAWVGEHHSAGYEIIPSPEVFIAVAAERTKNIRLGTGVSSLPYHHPLMLADRMVLLDHLTRGRIMMGVGPGALPSDAFMMGIPVADQRDRMEEALEAILLLLSDEEPVTMKTDWFTLDNARVNVRPYTWPHFDIAVASQVSPTGARAAGKFGLSLLSLGATNTAGFDMLAYNWDICEQRAAEFGTTVDRKQWRLVGPMHIAETKEQAYRDVQFGLEQWIDYFQRVAALPIAPH